MANYTGHLYDEALELYYAKARVYSPQLGRFTQEDPYWNLGNMIYGNNPNKRNERSVPNIAAIMASNNLYAYCFNSPLTYRDPSGLIPTAIYDFWKNYAGEYSWTAKGDRYAVTINDKTLKYDGAGKNKHRMNIWVEDGNLMAEDYALAYFFRVDGWIEYMPGFEWMDYKDYLLRVDAHQYFLSKPFCSDFANEVTAMKGTDSLYAGLTEKGIAAESFVHALGYYYTQDIKQLHPDIASVNNSSGVIDIASTDDRIPRFEEIWEWARVKDYLFNIKIFK